MDADGTDGDLLDQAIVLGRGDRQEEERRKREEEEEEGDRRRREEEEERRRREEDGRRRREEEEERREREEEEEMRRREEERRRRQEEWRRKEEEWRREEEEEMRRREEEEEMRRREEESRRRQEEQRKQEKKLGRRRRREEEEERRRREAKQLKQGRRREGNLETTRPPFPIKPYSENESRVERTLYVNTWLLIIILLLLALVLGKRVFKKVFPSRLKVTHPKNVRGTRAEDEERTGGIEEDFTTENTDIMYNESALLLNYDDESPELNQQVCTAETKGACVHRGDLPFQVRQAKHFLSLTEDLRQLFTWLSSF